MTTCRSRISAQGINIIRAEPDVETCFCFCDRLCWITASPPHVSLVHWMALSVSSLHPDGSSLPSLGPAVLGHLIGQSYCLTYDWQVPFPNSRFCSTYCPMPAALEHLLVDQSCCLTYDWQLPFPNSLFCSSYCLFLMYGLMAYGSHLEILIHTSLVSDVWIGKHSYCMKASSKTNQVAIGTSWSRCFQLIA